MISGFTSCLILFLSIHYKNFSFLVVIFFLLGISSSCHTAVYSFIARELPATILGFAEGFLSSLVMIVGPVYQIMYGWLLEYHWNGIYENGAKHYSSQSHHLAIFFVCITVFMYSMICQFLGKRYCFIGLTNSKDMNPP